MEGFPISVIDNIQSVGIWTRPTERIRWISEEFIIFNRGLYSTVRPKDFGVNSHQ